MPYSLFKTYIYNYLNLYMIMRVFISLDIPEDIRDEIMKIQKCLPEFKGKVIEKENLHLTLKFLGEISDELVEKTKKKLSEVKFKKFEAEISELGVFNPNFIRIIWIKLENCDELQKEIDNKLENLFSKEKRFMSHLTIARVKSVKDKKEFLEKLKEIRYRKLKFKVDRFCLKQSILHEDKPEYKVIEEYLL